MGLRILHAVEYYSPSVGGAQEVVRQISERLAARGHEVTVATTRLGERRATTLRGVRIAEFDITGNQVRGMRGDVAAYRDHVLQGAYDVVMTYAAQQWTTDALLPVLERIPAATVLAPCGFSGLRNRAHTAYFNALPERLRHFDALLFHSERYQDIEFARSAGLDRLVVVPNGADEREFGEPRARGTFRRLVGLADHQPLILTVGGHTGLKGHAAAMSAFARSASGAGGALVIVGNTPTGRGCLPSCRIRRRIMKLVRPDRRILLVDPPREAVLQAYADADLFLFCSAVECSPLVLFEAMAAGLPFVTADVGNAAEIAEWSQAGVVVPARRDRNGLARVSRRKVARACDGLLQDPALRDELATRGRRAWEASFRWDLITARYEALYERLAAPVRT